jgi:hypothetical protein
MRATFGQGQMYWIESSKLLVSTLLYLLYLAQSAHRLLARAGGKKLQWDYIHGLYENAIYGGRVDNSFDTRVLVSYLNDFFNDLVLSGTGQAKKTLFSGINLPTRNNYQVKRNTYF